MERALSDHNETDMEYLDEQECWARLSGAEVCRLAFPLDGRIEILPVNCLALHQRLFVRTVPESAVDRAIGQSIAFEVDGWTGSEAWSVVVRGELRIPLDLNGPGGTGGTDELQLAPWPTREKPPTVLVELVPFEIRGRRFARRQPGVL